MSSSTPTPENDLSRSAPAGESASPFVTIFVHVPKTAGTTLERMLQQSMPAEEVYSIRKKKPPVYREELARLSQEKPCKLRVVSGHSPFGLHECLSVPSRYITVLRDPVERLVSFYYYAAKEPGHKMYKEISSGAMDIVGLAERIANQQVRYLAGMPDGVPDANDLEVAKQNITDRFEVVGFMERFEETLALLHSTLGWRFESYLRENVNTRRPAVERLAKAEFDAIRGFHALDYALYEFAEQRFNAQIAKAGDAYHNEVRRLRRAGRVTGFIAGIRRLLGR